MPQAVVVAGITAAGGLAGAKLASDANKRGVNAQAQATKDALAYEREKEVLRKVEHDKAVALYKEQYDAWKAQRDAILAKHGIGAAQPKPAAPALGQAPAQAPAMGGTAFAGGSQPQRLPQTLAGMMPAQPAAPAAEPALIPQEPRRLADMGGWADWSRYGA